MKVRSKLRLRSWFEAQLEGVAPLASSPPRFETAASHVPKFFAHGPLRHAGRRRCFQGLQLFYTVCPNSRSEIRSVESDECKTRASL